MRDRLVRKLDRAPKRAAAGIASLGRSIAGFFASKGNANLSAVKKKDAPDPDKAGSNNQAKRHYSAKQTDDLVARFNKIFHSPFLDYNKAEAGCVTSCEVKIDGQEDISVDHTFARDIPNQLKNFEFKFLDDDNGYISYKNYEAPGTKHEDNEQLKDWISFLRDRGIEDRDITAISKLCNQGFNAVLQVQQLQKPELQMELSNGQSAFISQEAKNRSWRIEQVEGGFDITYTFGGPLDFLLDTEGTMVSLNDKSSFEQEVTLNLRRTSDDGDLAVTGAAGLRQGRCQDDGRSSIDLGSRQLGRFQEKWIRLSIRKRETIKSLEPFTGIRQPLNGS